MCKDNDDNEFNSASKLCSNKIVNIIDIILHFK